MTHDHFTYGLIYLAQQTNSGLIDGLLSSPGTNSRNTSDPGSRIKDDSIISANG